MELVVTSQMGQKAQGEAMWKCMWRVQRTVWSLR